MILSTGVVSWVGPDYISIRTSIGGLVRAPFFEGFKRGDEVEYRTNGGKTAILSVYHKGEGQFILNPRPLLDLRKEAEVNATTGAAHDWEDEWIFPIWEFYGSVV